MAKDWKRKTDSEYYIRLEDLGMLIFYVRTPVWVAGEMAQRLGASIAFLEDPGSIPTPIWPLTTAPIPENLTPF